MDLLGEDTDEEELLAAALHFDTPEAPPAKRRSFEFGPPARDLNHKPQTSGRSTVLNATENILRNAQPQHGVTDPKLPSDTSSTAAAEPSLGASSVNSGRHAIQGRTSAGAKASVLADPPVLRNPTSSSNTPALRTPVLDYSLRQPTSFVTKSDKFTANASGIISSCGKRPSAAAGSSSVNLRPNLQQPVMNRTSANAAPAVLRNAVNSYSASALSSCPGPPMKPVPLDNAPSRPSSRPDSNVEDCESMFDYGEDEDDLLLSSACEASEAVVSRGQSRNDGDNAVHMIGNVSNPLNNPSVSRYQTPCPGQSSYRDKHPGRDSPSVAPSRVGACSEWDSPVVASSKDSGSEDTPRQRGMKRKRKFPGPAGLLPSMSTGLSMGDVKMLDPKPSPKLSLPQVPDVSPSQLSCSQGDVFSDAPWQTLKQQLEPQAHKVLASYSLKAISKLVCQKQLPKGKVPLLALVITNLDIRNADASVMVRDPSGEMRGTLHRQLVKEHGHVLQVGTALLLRQVGVFSPSGRTHYLNITPNNVVCIYNRSMEGELLSSRLTSLLPEDFSPPLEPQSTNQSASPSPRVEPGDRNVRPALFGKAGPGMRPAMPPGIRPRMPPQAPGAYNSPNAVRPGPRFPPNSYQPRPHSSGAPPRFNPSPGHAPYRPGGTPHRSATSGSQMTQTVVANQTGPRMTPPPLVSSRPPAVGHMTNQSPQFAAAQQTPGVTVANQPPRFTANQTPHRQPAPNSSGGSSHNNNSINQRTMNSSTPAVSGCQKSFSFKTPGSSGQHVGSTKLASPQVDAPVPTANLHFSMPGELDDLLTGLEDEMMCDF